MNSEVMIVVLDEMLFIYFKMEGSGLSQCLDV